MAFLGGIMQACAWIWAAVGVGNVFIIGRTGTTNDLAFAIISNVLLFWLPAAIVLYIGSRIRKSAEASANLRPCPKCAEPIQLAATLCRHCGSTVPPALKPSVYDAA